jgi:hypothetical protein
MYIICCDGEDLYLGWVESLTDGELYEGTCPKCNKHYRMLVT